jgi:hypothetical protein
MTWKFQNSAMVKQSISEPIFTESVWGNQQLITSASQKLLNRFSKNIILVSIPMLPCAFNLNLNLHLSEIPVPEAKTKLL